MKITSSRSRRLILAASFSLVAAVSGRSQIAYSVDRFGSLFRLDLAAPAATATIGNVGFVPEGMDFRTGTSSLFAIDVGPSVTQLYTIDVTSGAATPVGAGFASAGSVGGIGYSLLGASSYGFDFNPTTLQADGSIRIRFTANNGTNLRLHSATGQIAAVDGSLTTGSTIGGVAYINNAVATQGGATGLYDIDFATDTLFFQNPPNAGTLTPVGSLNVDVGPSIGFDILTSLVGGDAGIGGDSAYLVDSSPNGSRLFSVDLATGAATQLGTIARDFSGGLAIATPVPEPAHFGAVGAAAIVGLLAFRRRGKKVGSDKLS